ncbi:MAG: hypothetical protein ABIQ15_07260 [Nocardioides sp.]
MSKLKMRTATAIASLGAGIALTALPAAPATAGDFGQRVRTCAQTHGFNADVNPGMHRGITGWDPTHEC